MGQIVVAAAVSRASVGMQMPADSLRKNERESVAGERSKSGKQKLSKYRVYTIVNHMKSIYVRLPRLIRYTESLIHQRVRKGIKVYYIDVPRYFGAFECCNGRCRYRILRIKHISEFTRAIIPSEREFDKQI